MRYYIGFLLAIGLGIVLILLLFAGGNGTKLKPAVIKSLNTYASTSAVASMTTDGPINAVSQHVAIQINISNTEATINEFQGYDQQIVNSQSYPNTQSAYYAFLSALMVAEFTDGNKSAALDNDTGRCPTGVRYDYRLTENGQSLEHFWATSCGGATYLGNVGLTNQLFRAQIPDYAKFTQNTNI